MNDLSAIESIFFTALGKGSPAERAAYLDEACGPNSELRSCVERMLQAYPMVGSFLQPRASGLAPTVDVPRLVEQPGTRLGPYKLMEQIGEGGMGIVFVAEQQEPVRRKVALKIIKPGMDSQQVIARFEAERQALAMMDHPNIARVFDAGTTDSGRPFFVMELVHGVPITQYCDDNKLTPRQRLELFVPVCQAIQHAHQKGIIHRDLKPSNVLVTLYDDKPVPKIIDFGVAKAIEQRLTERTVYTQFGTLVGTFEYMSPEQAEMNALGVDTRSDIYALGVLLYELLTGTTPLERQRLREAAFGEIVRLIKEEEPPRPSVRLSTSGALAKVAAARQTDPVKLSRLMRGELDWVVMKCLEKDRSRRYETANGLAHDIERYLKDEPVEACPPSTGYRLRKFLRKHRAAVLMALALGGMLVLGTAISTWQAIRAMRAERVAFLERDEKEQARQMAVDAALAERHSREAEALHRKQAEAERDARQAALTHAEGLRLTAQSAVMLPTNPGLALLLAAEGAERARPRGAAHNNALLAALRACREMRTLRGKNVAFRSARFSPDGRSVVTTSGPTEGRRLDAYASMAAQVWDTASGGLRLTVRVPGLFCADAQMSPDGQRLLTTFEGAAIVRQGDGRQSIYTDRVVRIWDVASGEERAVLKGHTNRVVSACFSPDGRQVLTASWDRTARLWDAVSGKPLTTLAAERYSLAWAAFSADGRRVLTLSGQSDSHSSAEVGEHHQRAGWKPNAEVDPPWRPGVVVQKIQSLFGTRTGGGAWSSNEETRRRARLWDASTGKEVAVLIQEKDRKSSLKEPTCAAFSPDGRRVLTGDVEGTTNVWDAADGKRLTGWGPPPLQTNGRTRTGTLRSVALSADGDRLLRVHTDHSISVVDTANGKEMTHLTGFPAGVSSAAFSPDGSCVLILPGDEHRREQRHWFPGSDGRLVLTVPEDRAVYLRDAATGRETAVFLGHEDDVTSAHFSPDGRQVVTASVDGTVRLWNPGSVDDTTTVLRGHRSALSIAAFSPDGQLLLTAFGLRHEVIGSHGGDREVRVWDRGGRQVSQLKGLSSLGDAPVRDRLLGAVREAQFSSDGRRVLTLSRDYWPRPARPDTQVPAKWTFTPVRIWDARTGEERLALQGFTCDVRSADFSPDGRFVLTVCASTQQYRVLTSAGEERGMGSEGGKRDHTVRIWNAATGAVVHTLIGKDDWCDGAAWSPDGRRIVTAGYTSASRFNNYQLTLWDAATGRQVGTLDGKPGPIQEVKFSPDGKRILGFRRTYIDKRELVPLWDVATGKSLAVLTGHQGEVTSATFSPDSRLIVTTSLDRTARLWDAASGRLRVVLGGHERAVHMAAFSPDGRWVVTASDDATARLWDVASGREVFTLTGHAGPVFAAVFSPNSQQVLTVSGDGTGRVWSIDPLPRVLARKPRELTSEERRRYTMSDAP